MKSLIGFTGGISIYPTPDSLNQKIEEYFEQCFEYIEDSRGRYKRKEIETPTFSGLARYLGFSSRAQMLSYKNDENPEFEAVISDAKLRLEEYLEAKLVNCKGNPAGLMFALKNNASWEETTKQQVTTREEKPIAFAWATDAKDVIDITAEENKKEGGLPPPTPQIEGPIGDK